MAKGTKKLPPRKNGRFVAANGGQTKSAKGMTLKGKPGMPKGKGSC
jgi:hypothetical protein